MTENNTQGLLVKVAVLGGTGKEGSGLARRWALNGYQVMIGSRSAERAQEKVTEINGELGGDYLTGMGNAEAAEAADLVVLSVPYSAHAATLESVKDKLSGKILVDVTVPTPFPEAAVVPEGKAAALEAQAIVGDDVRVVSAFQNVSAGKIKKTGTPVDTDVLVTGDDADAKADVIALVEAAGMRGLDAGPLANAVAAEALTAVLYYINKTYKVRGAGVRITGI
ncbi:MAG: NADPH-dependent F420 reductase [Chloroflexota bacterium]